VKTQPLADGKFDLEDVDAGILAILDKTIAMSFLCQWHREMWKTEHIIDARRENHGLRNLLR